MFDVYSTYSLSSTPAPAEFKSFFKRYAPPCTPLMVWLSLETHGCLIKKLFGQLQMSVQNFAILQKKRKYKLTKRKEVHCNVCFVLVLFSGGDRHFIQDYCNITQWPCGLQQHTKSIVAELGMRLFLFESASSMSPFSFLLPPPPPFSLPFHNLLLFLPSFLLPFLPYPSPTPGFFRVSSLVSHFRLYWTRYKSFYCVAYTVSKDSLYTIYVVHLNWFIQTQRFSLSRRGVYASAWEQSRVFVSGICKMSRNQRCKDALLSSA